MTQRAEFRVLGKKTPRKDGIAKVTGQEKFASDIDMPNMLHARILKSSYSHARVKSIDVSAAEDMGAYTITFSEIPDVKYCPRLVSIPESTYKDWKVLSDKPVYVGEPLAAVAAETEEEAQRALEAVKVEYETFDAYFDVFESMEKGSVQLHEEIFLKDEVIRVQNNIACKLEIEEGDVEKGFEEADIVLERTYKTTGGTMISLRRSRSL